MTQLNDNIWKTLVGGYKILYDPSIELKLLTNSSDKIEIENILDRLFENLYHQGDIGTASIYSLPQLVNIGIANKIYSSTLLNLIGAIEQTRQLYRISIPSNIESDYENALISAFKLIDFNQNWDEDFLICSLSLIATLKGRIDIANVVEHLNDAEYLNQARNLCGEG